MENEKFINVTKVTCISCGNIICILLLRTGYGMITNPGINRRLHDSGWGGTIREPLCNKCNEEIKQDGI